MKYFFYPERRFVTFAPIMSNNPKSPIIDLQQQQLLLRMEYEYEKEEFKRQTETMGVARKVKRGLCWYPVSLGRSYYNSLNQLVRGTGRHDTRQRQPPGGTARHFVGYPKAGIPRIISCPLPMAEQYTGNSSQQGAMYA